MKRLLLLLLIILSYINSYSQENEEEKKNLLSISLGYTYIPQGASHEAEVADGVFIPSIGIDYLRRIHPRYEIGLMFDMEFGEYIVIDKELNRENAIAIVAIGSFSLTKHINVFAGGGIEIEKHHNLGIIRLGTEYNFRFKKGWVIAPGFIYDFKEGINTWSLSVAFGKEF